MTSLRLALAAVLLASLPIAAQETGFLRGEGKMDVVLTYGEDTYNEFWVDTNKVDAPPVGRIKRRNYNLYVAYGLNNDVDLIGNASYVRANSDGNGGISTESSLQDMLLAAKIRVHQQPMGSSEFSFLLFPGVKIPINGDYENDAPTAIGDGQTDYRGRVIAHWKWDNGVFTSIETGYDKRGGKPKDEWPFNVTLGLPVADQLTLMPFVGMVDSMGGIDINQVPAQGGFDSTEEDYTRYGINAYYRITETFGLTGSWRATTDGKNTGDVDAFSIGTVFRF